LPSSFARDHSRALVFSTRLPVSVYGTVTSSSPSRGFSWQHGVGGFVPRRDRYRALALNGATDLPIAPAYTLQPALPIAGPLILLRHPNVQTTIRWYRNIDLFPIDYAFRPAWFSHALSLLVPAESLPYAPAVLSIDLQCEQTAPLPRKVPRRAPYIRSFGTQLEPR